MKTSSMDFASSGISLRIHFKRISFLNLLYVMALAVKDIYFLNFHYS